jgi:hypothetical protein
MYVPRNLDDINDSMVLSPISSRGPTISSRHQYPFPIANSRAETIQSPLISAQVAQLQNCIEPCEPYRKYMLGLAKYMLGLAKYMLGLAKYMLGLAKYMLGLATNSFMSDRSIPPTPESKGHFKRTQSQSVAKITSSSP